jgi:ribosome-associated heat shock protein Hsp15
MPENLRIDKYLWAVRIFKTRTDAAQACTAGKVQVNGYNAKPSKTVNPGDLLAVRKGIALFSYKVLGLTEHRIGAALVPQFLEDCTPEEEKEKFRSPMLAAVPQRDRGAGRPTKKERRMMGALLSFLEED